MAQREGHERHEAKLRGPSYEECTLLVTPNLDEGVERQRRAKAEGDRNVQHENQDRDGVEATRDLAADACGYGERCALERGRARFRDHARRVDGASLAAEAAPLKVVQRRSDVA